MMLIILLLLTFFLNAVYAIDLVDTEVSLPLGLYQLDKTILEQGKFEINYKLKTYQNTTKTVILPKVVSTKSIDGFMSTLVYSYIKQDPKLFKKLLSPQGAKKLDMNSEKFKFSFDYLKKIKKPHIKYAFEYQKGVIVSWSAIGLITDRIIYLRNTNAGYKMFELSVPKDDHLFWNMGLYFKNAPFEIHTPQMPKIKKIGTKYKLNIDVHGFKSWLFIYALDNKNKSNFIAVSDNYPNNKPYKDYNLISNAIELKVDSNDFKRLGKKLYIVETNFFLESIPKNIHKKAVPLELP